MEQKSKIVKRDRIDQDLSLEARLDLAEPSSSVENDRKVVRPDQNKAAVVPDEAMREAAQIRERARVLYTQVEDKIREAEEKGFESGRQEGLASVTEMLVSIQENNQELLADIEKQCVALCYEIARKVIGDVFTSSDQALIGMVRQALQSAMGRELKVLVNPQDFEKIKTQQPKFAAALQGSQSLEIKPAESVPLNGVVVESELGTIEADLATQLSAIRKALKLPESE